jgi:alpha-tubulin suppressor-like RCC1 family protein
MSGILQSLLASFPSGLADGIYAWNQFSTSNGTALGLNNTTYYPFSSPGLFDTPNTSWDSFAEGLAVKSGGSIWSWGLNASGQSGQNDRVSRSSPVQIGALTTWSNVAGRIASKNSYCAAIRTDGTLWMWGANGSGQLGLNDRVARSSPVQVTSLNTWTNIGVFGTTTLDSYVLGVSNGRLYAWGDGANGRIAQDSVIDRSSPTQIGSLTNWTEVAANGLGGSHARKTDGTMWSWGLGLNGSLGLNDAASRSSPTQIGSLTTWAALASRLGQGNLGALKTDNTIWMWGGNAVGQLGQNDLVVRSSPVQVTSATNWSQFQISGTNAGIFAINTSGEIWSWGSSTELGARSSPVQLGSINKWSTMWIVSGDAGYIRHIP